ncbi:TPA: SDR family oxidoreductase [Citrobacter freundii]
MQHILLTGASGFIGGAVLCNLLKNYDNIRVLLLIRGRNTEEALQRVKDNMRRFALSEELVSNLKEENIILGDLITPETFLDDRRLNNVTHVLNCAAIASFGKNPQIWQVNVEGTLKLAERMGQVSSLERFIHVGTAMSCAPEPYSLVTEKVTNTRQHQHIVEYTWSKAEAEKQMLAHCPDLPLIIARPSIVVGHTTLGCIPSSSIFWVFRMALILKKFMCSLDDHIDVIPVDYCARALTLLLMHPQVNNRIYHISAGEESSVSFAEIDAAMGKALNLPPVGEQYEQVEYRDLVKIRKKFHSLFGDCNERIMLQAMRIYGEFSRLSVRFSGDRLRQLGLEPSPRFSDYLHHCVHTTQGKTIQQLMEADFK